MFHDGDADRKMYVIQAGRVRISKAVRDVDKTLVVLGPGELFGEMSILNNQPRPASTTVEEDARLLVIDPKNFEAMVRGNSEIAGRMVKKLAARLQEADDKIENLLLRDHNSRVVHFLATYARKHGKLTAEGTRLHLNVRELAAKIGTEFDSVNEVINKLLRVKLVKVESNAVVIHDLPRLREFLEFLEIKQTFGNI